MKQQLLNNYYDITPNHQEQNISPEPEYYLVIRMSLSVFLMLWNEMRWLGFVEEQQSEVK